MKYLSILRMSESHLGTVPPPAFGAAMAELIEKNRRMGVLIDTGGLKSSKEGFRMRVAGGALLTTDGPFPANEEAIGGWAIMQADSSEDIRRLTAEFLDLYRTHWPGLEVECEVRPIEFLMSDAERSTE